MNDYKDIIKGIKTIIKPAFSSFILIYCIVYLTLKFYKVSNLDISFWNKASLFNGITAIIITVFCTLIYYLLTHRKITKRDYEKTSLTTKNIVLIWLIGTFLYLTIISILGNIIPIKYAIIIALFGVVNSVIISYGIKYIVARQNKSITNIVFIIIYIVNIILLPALFLESLEFLGKNFGGLFQYNSSKSIGVNLVRGVVIFGSYFLLLTLSIHIYFIYEINRNQKQNLKQIGITASLKYQQLKAQLSPHFLFNNISVLTGLIEENQEKAIQFSEKLSHVYRYFLNQENTDLVLLKEELVFAKEYLKLLQVRFENAIIFTDETDGFSNYYILPMALQQVFENIIKHNEISIESPMDIEMTFEKNYLVIKNSKYPKDSTGKGENTGLENIINRYAFFTDEKVIIINNKHYYTIKLPLLKAED
ncbi:sensor histidine kinase [Flavivirga aquimarina]|nr:sensor histidine kinase [Flavivirga aquimarina]